MTSEGIDDNAGVTPTKKALDEAFGISEEILKNLELSEIPLSKICLKASRLARLLNEPDMETVFVYEASGYPSEPDGIPPETWRLAVLAGRVHAAKDAKGELTERASTQSVGSLEESIRLSELRLSCAADPDFAASSANPTAMLPFPTSNRAERQALHQAALTARKDLESRQAFLYSYVARKNMQLAFSKIPHDIFAEARRRVDERIGQLLPNAAQKMAAIYRNLESENSEDWSNAVHGCRRVLVELADAVFPSTGEVRQRTMGGKLVPIKLGQDNYINRLVAFVEDQSESTRSADITGSHLHYMGDRLDALNAAASKGTHSDVGREEADRYVVYTYLIVGDILSLLSEAGRA
jgi:AbiTii